RQMPEYRVGIERAAEMTEGNACMDRMQCFHQHLGVLEIAVGFRIVELEDQRLGGEPMLLQQGGDPLHYFRVLQAGAAQADQQARIGTLAAAVLGQPGYRTGDQPAINVDGQAGFQGGSMEFRVRDLLSLTVEQPENGLVMLGTVAPQADDGLELQVETVGFQGMADQGNKVAAVSQLFQLFQRIEYL